MRIVIAYYVYSFGRRWISILVFREDDDINDVAAMGGVNLNEENARILASQVCFFQ